VGPRAGLDDMGKRKFLTLSGLELEPSVVQPVASRYTDYAIPASKSNVEASKMWSDNTFSPVRSNILIKLTS
jgi:hypothetical protein